jgi:hypothetical protein
MCPTNNLKVSGSVRLITVAILFTTVSAPKNYNAKKQSFGIGYMELDPAVLSYTIAYPTCHLKGFTKNEEFPAYARLYV